MSDSIINIILNTVKKGGGDKETLTGLKKLSAGVKEFTGFNIGAVTSIGAVSMAMGKLITYTRQSIDATIEHNYAAMENARVTGNQVEQMSRLMEVADDAFVPIDQLTKGLKTATTDGIDTSIAGILRLSEQYRALPDATEKAQFVTETFGKKNEAMAKLLALGRDEIVKRMGAVSNSLVVDEEAAKMTTEYKESLDYLQDSLAGVGYKVSKEVMPFISDLNTVMGYLIDKASQQQGSFGTLGRVLFDVASGPFGLLIESNRLAIEGIGNWADKIRGDGIPAAEDLGKEVGEENLAGDVKQVTQYFKDLTKEIIFNHLASKMDAGAQMELARQMGLINRETYDTLNSLDALNAKYDTNGDGVLQLTEKTKEYNAELAQIKGYQDSLVDKTIEYVIHISEIRDSNVSTVGLNGQGPHNAYIGMASENRAVGGPVQAGHPYWVGEEGPEPFIPAVNGTIIPHDQAFGNVTININGAGDPKAVAREVMREMKLQGVGR
ncbi:MAG: hypothetical protein GYA45_11615 [Pelolinea sp.]|nr:hypothetical protein [Pelolinea sp.]